MSIPIRGTLSSIIFALLVLSVSGVAQPISKVSLSGRFIAYRPSDRVAQTASFITNKEAFLLQIEGAKPSKIVKIEYEHAGYSDITGETLENAPLLSLKVRRNASCDQSYGQFVSTAPTMRDEKSGKEMVGGIKFVAKYQSTQLPSDTALKCYALQKGDFRIVGAK
jgi:hypothetical protein